MLNSTLLFSFGTGEIILVIAIVLLLFGGRKIPELMRGLGRGVKEFKDAQNGIAEEADKTAAQQEKKKDNERIEEKKPVAEHQEQH